MTNKQLSVLIGAILFGFVIFTQDTPLNNFGSVNRGNEYHSTTTRAYPATSLTDPTVLCSTPGALGSVVVTGANTSIINFYDATTTGPHSDHATTTVATLPASLAAGTYTFDVLVTRGLVFDQDGGTLATTTITYRCN